jgi:hypothetical protein
MNQDGKPPDSSDESSSSVICITRQRIGEEKPVIGVKKEIQLAVDEYLRLYAEYKRIKDELDALREVIEPYMKTNEIPAILATDGSGEVELTQQERPIMSSRYTSYDVDEIAALLQPSIRKKCIVEVVDKDKLEALCKLGEVPPAVLERKITKPSYTFAVRLVKA